MIPRTLCAVQGCKQHEKNISWISRNILEVWLMIFFFFPQNCLKFLIVLYVCTLELERKIWFDVQASQVNLKLNAYRNGKSVHSSFSFNSTLLLLNAGLQQLFPYKCRKLRINRRGGAIKICQFYRPASQWYLNSRKKIISNVNPLWKTDKSIDVVNKWQILGNNLSL